MDESEAESSVGMREKEESRMNFRVFLVVLTGSSAEPVTRGEKSPKKITAYSYHSLSKILLLYVTKICSV